MIGGFFVARRVLRRGNLLGVTVAGAASPAGAEAFLTELRREFDAPVVPVFCAMLADGTYRIDFREPLHIPEDAPRRGQILPWVQSYLRTLEDEVRRHPDNSNDYFFWEPAAEGVTPGSG